MKSQGVIRCDLDSLEFRQELEKEAIQGEFSKELKREAFNMVGCRAPIPNGYPSFSIKDIGTFSKVIFINSDGGNYFCIVLIQRQMLKLSTISGRLAFPIASKRLLLKVLPTTLIKSWIKSPKHHNKLLSKGA